MQAFTHPLGQRRVEIVGMTGEPARQLSGGCTIIGDEVTGDALLHRRGRCEPRWVPGDLRTPDHAARAIDEHRNLLKVELEIARLDDAVLQGLIVALGMYDGLELALMNATTVSSGGHPGWAQAISVTRMAASPGIASSG